MTYIQGSHGDGVHQMNSILVVCFYSCHVYEYMQCLFSQHSLKLTYVEDLYLLAGISPPDIRRDVCARMERTKQME